MYLVIIKQRIKYTQEIELTFLHWEEAQKFVHTALMNGKGIVVEVMDMPEPTGEMLAEIPDTIDDTDFNN